MADDPSGKPGNIIPHDFGHDKRSKARRLRQQLDLNALHEINVRDNPVPYLERASERIFQLERALFEANLAARELPVGFKVPDGTVTLSHADYEKLRACAEAVMTAYATLVSSKQEQED